MRFRLTGLGMLALIGCTDSMDAEADAGSVDAAVAVEAAAADTGGALASDAKTDAGSSGTLYVFDTKSYAGPDSPLFVVNDVLVFTLSTDAPTRTVTREMPGDLLVSGFRTPCSDSAPEFLPSAISSGLRSVAPAHLVEVGVDFIDPLSDTFCFSYRVRGQWQVPLRGSSASTTDGVHHARKKVDAADVDAVAIFYANDRATVHSISYRLLP